MPISGERKFVFAPDMQKLGAKVDEARRAVEEAERLVENIEDANDVAERLVFLVGHIRDWERGLVSNHELRTAATIALGGMEEHLPDEMKEVVRGLL